MTKPTPVKGIPLKLGEVTYTLPPANLATLESVSAQLDKINAGFANGSGIGLGDMLFVADFATACLRRNYPDMDRALVANHIGLENVVDVLQMCLDTSGLLRSQLEAQAAQAGHSATATEGNTLGESAGTASSPTS